MSAVQSRPRAPLKNRYQSGFFCARFQSSFVKKLALLGTGPALASSFRCVRICFLAQEDDKDVAEKNSRYFGCFSLAIPTRTIKNRYQSGFFCARFQSSFVLKDFFV